MIAFAGQVQIENPRKYDAAVLDELRLLLQQGGNAVRDPRRKTCYEIVGPEGTFYVHVSPVSGNIVLIARWTRHLVARPADAACFAAR